MNSYINKVNNIIKTISKKNEKIMVLEAGCGASSDFDFGSNTHITGVDVSTDQLKNNEVVNEKIKGDIQVIDLPSSNYDIIICWEVLEHIKNPDLVLKNFIKWLKDHGIIIICVPNVLSLKGLITKFTPYKFHLWCNRKVLKWGSTPFSTYLRMSLSPEALKKFAKKNSLNIELLEFGTKWAETLKKRSPFVYYIYYTLALILKIFTFGLFKIKETDFIIIYRR